jgi:hypothetical protein
MQNLIALRRGRYGQPQADRAIGQALGHRRELPAIAGRRSAGNDHRKHRTLHERWLDV